MSKREERRYKRELQRYQRGEITEQPEPPGTWTDGEQPEAWEPPTRTAVPDPVTDYMDEQDRRDHVKAVLEQARHDLDLREAELDGSAERDRQAAIEAEAIRIERAAKEAEIAALIAERQAEAEATRTKRELEQREREQAERDRKIARDQAELDYIKEHGKLPRPDWMPPPLDLPPTRRTATVQITEALKDPEPPKKKKKRRIFDKIRRKKRDRDE